MKFFITLLLTLGILCQLMAQEIPTLNDSIGENEIVITHSKVTRSIKYSTKSMILIDQKSIEESGSNDLSQLLDSQTGIIINGAWSNPGKNKTIYMQGAAGEYTLILIDGIPVHDPSTIGNTFDIRNISLSQIEKVEILKGSQSTLYGSDAVAGVINIITKKTIDQSLQLNGKLAYGSFNTLDGNVGMSGSSDKIGYNLSTSYVSSDGLSEAAEEGSGNTFDKDGYNRTTIQGALNFTPNNQLTIRPFVRYSNFDSDYDNGSFSDGTDTYEAKFINSGINAVHKTDKITTHFSYAYTDQKRLFFTSFGDSEYKGKLHDIEAFADTKLSKKSNLTFGVNYQSHQMIGNSVDDTDPSDNIFALYSNLLLRPSDIWNIEAGIRYNNHSRFGENTNFSLSSSYWLSSNSKVYASLGTAFKAPQLSQLYGQFGANPDLQPSTSIYWNLGLSWQSADKQLGLDGSFFSRQIDDIIIYYTRQLDDTVLRLGYINQNEQNDNGVEINLNWKPSSSFKFSAGYTFLTGETTLLDDNGNSVTDDILLRRPKHQLDFDLLFNPTSNWQIGIHNILMSNRDELFFDFSDFTNKAVELDSYFLTNLNTNYQINSNWRLFANIQNVFDINYSELYGYSTLGRSFTVGVRFIVN